MKNKGGVALIKELLALTKQDFSDVQIGRSMALYRAQNHRILELLRNLALERVCLIIQRWTRACLARKFKAKLLKIRPVLVAAMQSQGDLEKVSNAVAFAEETVGTYNRIFPFKSKEWLECQEMKRQLVERKRVTEACAACLPHDPETNFANLEKAVQSVIAIESYPGTPQQLKTCADARAMYDLTVRKRTCRAELKRGTAEAERDTLEKNLALAVELGLGNAPEVAPAKQMVERCKQEEVLCQELRAAQASGGITAHAQGQGALNPQAPLAAAQKAAGFGMRTAEGKYLQSLCEFLNKLRTAMQSVVWEGHEDWPAVRALIEQLGPMRRPVPAAAAPVEEGEEGEEKVEETAEDGWVEPDKFDIRSQGEVRWAADELDFRQRKRDVLSVLQQGIDELNEETVKRYSEHLKAKAYVGGPDQMQRNKQTEEKLFAEAESQLARISACREALESSVASGDEYSLQQSISSAEALPVDHTHAVALLEPFAKAKIMLAMKFKIDYGRRVEIGLILDDELAESSVASVIAHSTGNQIEVMKSALIQELQTQTTSLDAALQFAASITIVGDAALRIVDRGTALLALRKCLLNRDWANLDSKLSTALSAQVEGPESNLAKDETAGRCTAADCLEALKQATDDVAQPSTDFGHPSEGVLESRLEQAERLEMKDLPEIVAGREMLEKIRDTRKNLQAGLDLSMYADAIGLAEEFNQLYTLFDASTSQLNKALQMAQAFNYATKETTDAQALLSEITILWYLQEDMQSGGYYDGASPTAAPQTTVVVDSISQHYNDYSGFAYTSDIGQYIARKAYYIVMLRTAIADICNTPDYINDCVAQAVDIGCPTTPELVSATAFAEQLNATRQALYQAETDVKEDLLINAMAMADALFYNNADVERARALRDRVIELNEESRKALWVLDKARMQAVFDNATAIRLTTPHLEYIEMMLGMGAMDWLKFEIKKAKELGDDMRKTRLAIEMKDLTLDQVGNNMFIGNM